MYLIIEQFYHSYHIHNEQNCITCGLILCLFFILFIHLLHLLLYGAAINRTFFFCNHNLCLSSYSTSLCYIFCCCSFANIVYLSISNAWTLVPRAIYFLFVSYENLFSFHGIWLLSDIKYTKKSQLIV